MGNISIYIILAVAFIYFHNNQTSGGQRNDDLKRSILALNNELQRMRTENEWRNETVSQGKEGKVHVFDFLGSNHFAIQFS